MTTRLCVTGGRAITRENADRLIAALDMHHLRTPFDAVLHGDCPHPRNKTKTDQWVRDHSRFSADQIAHEWALRHGVHVITFRVVKSVDGEWPGAGPRRNRRMVLDGRPTHWIAASGGFGTAHCVRSLVAFGAVRLVDLREVAS